MAITIGMVNAKGGVAKTSSVANLAAALSERGLRVLMVDVDPQASLTVVCGQYEAAGREKKNLWMLLKSWLNWASDQQGIDPRSMVLHLPGYCGADLIPATLDLLAADQELLSRPGRELVLRAALTGLKDDYDIILLDSRPALGLLPDNVAAAADFVLIPMPAEEMAMQGLNLLLQSIIVIKRLHNKDLEILGLFVPMFQGRLKHAQEILAELYRIADKARQFGVTLTIFDTRVPRSTKVAEATKRRRSVLDYAPDSPGAQGYRQLAEELQRRIGLSPAAPKEAQS